MVPGTSWTTCTISVASRSSSCRSGPKTLTPTGVRMPVDSMSMRALIGMVQALLTPGNCKRRVHLGDQLIDRHAGRPFARRLQVDHRLAHLDRRRVGRGHRAAGLAEHRRDLRERLDDAVLRLQQLGRLGHRHARQRHRHEQQRAFVQARHEFAAELRGRPDRDAQDGDGGEHRQHRDAQHQADHRAVQPDQHPVDRVLVLRDDVAAHENSISTGTSVTDRIAPPAMAKVLV